MAAGRLNGSVRADLTFVGLSCGVDISVLHLPTARSLLFDDDEDEEMASE